MREKLVAYMPAPKAEPDAGPTVKQERLEDGTIGKSPLQPVDKSQMWTRADRVVDIRHNDVTDYEQERLRRIRENEDLIKQLGLGM